VNEAEVYADQRYMPNFAVKNDDLTNFRCFNAVYPSNQGNKIVIFGYKGFEKGVQRCLDQDSLRKTDPDNQKICRVTINDEHPRHKAKKYPLNRDNRIFEQMVNESTAANKDQDEKEIGDPVYEQEYIHHPVSFRGIHIMPVLTDNQLTYFDEKEGRYIPVPGIETIKNNDDDSD
jgi:hypothetical protein